MNTTNKQNTHRKNNSNAVGKTPKILSLLLIVFLTFSCSKNDDAKPVEPDTGYFVSKLTLIEPFGPVTSVFTYNENNTVQRIVSTGAGLSQTFDFFYNNNDLINKIQLDGVDYLAFTYENERLKTSVEFASDGIIAGELELNYNAGEYTSTSPPFAFTVDDQGQLLKMGNLEFSYNTNSGVHPHIKMQPAMYVLEGNHLLYLLISNQELTTMIENSDQNDFEAVRDENENITQLNGTPSSTGMVEIKWEMEYVEREL